MHLIISLILSQYLIIIKLFQITYYDILKTNVELRQTKIQIRLQIYINFQDAQGQMFANRGVVNVQRDAEGHPQPQGFHQFSMILSSAFFIPCKKSSPRKNCLVLFFCSEILVSYIIFLTTAKTLKQKLFDMFNDHGV